VFLWRPSDWHSESQHGPTFLWLAALNTFSLLLLPSFFFFIKQPTQIEQLNRLYSPSFTLLHHHHHHHHHDTTLSPFPPTPLTLFQTTSRCLSTVTATAAAATSRKLPSLRQWNALSPSSTNRSATSFPARPPFPRKQPSPRPQRQPSPHPAQLRSATHRTGRRSFGRSLDAVLLPPLRPPTAVSGGLRQAFAPCLLPRSPVCAPSSLTQQLEFQLTHFQVSLPQGPRGRPP
jgi:hypothetical protein